MRLDEASLSLCVLNPQYQLQPLWTWSNQQCVSEEMSCQVTARLHLGFLFVWVCVCVASLEKMCVKFTSFVHNNTRCPNLDVWDYCVSFHFVKIIIALSYFYSRLSLLTPFKSLKESCWSHIESFSLCTASFGPLLFFPVSTPAFLVISDCKWGKHTKMDIVVKVWEIGIKWNIKKCATVSEI